MKQTKKDEQGAILIEVIAVIALLGVMGPLLFKQIIARNEEIENVNIATEIRTMKEAFSSYIMENKEQLLDSCGAPSCFINVARTDIDTFLPTGYTRADYSFFLDINTENTTPFLQGYITPGYTSMPSDLKVKRAARIANLIGTDGGIFHKGGGSYEINGTAGTWGIDTDSLAGLGSGMLSDELTSLLDGDTTTATFLATTGMDTFIPQLEYEDFDMSTLILPDQLALKQVHAWNYFSVGQASEGSTGSCYELKHNTSTADGYITTLNEDTIYDVDGGDNCDPLFWVGSISDTTRAKNVYVKNDLHLGYNNGQATVSVTTDDADEEARSVIVYNISGDKKVVLNGKGEIISYGSDDIIPFTGGLAEKESLTLKEGAIHSNAKANLRSDVTGENENYRVDPAYTSVMNDISLESLGGNKISTLLKDTYLTKGFETISGPTDSVSIPECPRGYAPAVMITPTAFASEITQSDLEAIAQNVSVDITDGDVTATGLPRQRSTLVISVENGDAYGEAPNNNEWVVTMGYDPNDRDLLESEIKATAQTFCVFDSEAVTEVDGIPLPETNRTR